MFEPRMNRRFHNYIETLRAANYLQNYEIEAFLSDPENQGRLFGLYPTVVADVRKVLGTEAFEKVRAEGRRAGLANYNATAIWMKQYEETGEYPPPPEFVKAEVLIDYVPCQREAEKYRKADADRERIEAGESLGHGTGTRARKPQSELKKQKPLSYVVEDKDETAGVRRPEATVGGAPPKKKLSTGQRLLQERIRRELCRRSLLDLIENFEPDYEAGWAHREIAEKLEQFLQDVVDRKSPRLMLFLPPRFGKSLQASQYFPSFALGNYPWIEIIASSYAVSLPLGFSKKIRALVRDSEDFQGIFPELQLDPDTQGAEAWKTTRGGGYIAAGVGGPITGKGGHILIIDDPVKNWEEAESEAQRESVWNWYTSTLYTRQAPGAGILVIQTRWHDDDLSGRIIEQMNAAKEALDPDAEDWEVVSYPAIATKDEKHRPKGGALHPQRFDERALARIRKAVGERVWNALYQQNPTPDDGDYFKATHFLRYENMPPRHLLTVYMAWDLAITKNEENDPSVGYVIGVDSNDDWYVLDEIRGYWESDELIDQICDAVEYWKPSCTWLEKEKITMALGPALEREIANRKLYWAVIETVPPGRKDKIARARSMQGFMRRGKVLWPKVSPWVDEAKNEFLRFPNGKHDDRVDAAAYVFMMAAQLPAPSAPTGEKQKKSWKEKLSGLGRSGSPRDFMAG